MKAALTPPRLSRLGSPAVVYPGAFLVAFAEGMLNLGFVFFLRERQGASPSLIGWFTGYSVLVYTLGCLLLRRLFDRLRPQRALLMALYGMPAFLLLLVLLPALPLTFLFSGLYRLALAFFWSPAMGWLSQGVEGEALSRRQSRFNLSWSTGLVSSYVLAGLASQKDAGLPLVLSIAVFAGYAVLLTAALSAFPALRIAAPPASPAASVQRRGPCRRRHPPALSGLGGHVRHLRGLRHGGHRVPPVRPGRAGRHQGRGGHAGLLADAAAERGFPGAGGRELLALPRTLAAALPGLSGLLC